MTTKTQIPFKALNFEGTASAVDQFAKERNIPELKFPALVSDTGKASVEAVSLSVEPPKSKTPKRRVPLLLPEYVVKEVKRRALEADSTHQFVIMDAMRKGGIHIDEDDMIEDGRRLR